MNSYHFLGGKLTMPREWELPEVNDWLDPDNPYQVLRRPTRAEKLEMRKFRPEQLTDADRRGGTTRKWIELWPNRYMREELRVRNSLEGQVSY
jgi:hypothetical protein